MTPLHCILGALAVSDTGIRIWRRLTSLVELLTAKHLRTLHVGLRAIGKQFILDTLAGIEVLKKCGFRFSSSATNGSPGINQAQAISNGGGCRLLSVCTALRLVTAWKRRLSTPSMSTHRSRHPHHYCTRFCPCEHVSFLFSIFSGVAPLASYALAFA